MIESQTSVAPVSDEAALLSSKRVARSIDGQRVTDCSGCDLMAFSREKDTYFCTKTGQRLAFICSDNLETGFREYEEYIGSQCPFPEWDYEADPLKYWVKDGFEVCAPKTTNT